jgi:hypothetical protein
MKPIDARIRKADVAIRRSLDQTRAILRQRLRESEQDEREIDAYILHYPDSETKLIQWMAGTQVSSLLCNLRGRIRHDASAGGRD